MSSEPGAPSRGSSIPLSIPHLRGNEWVYVKDCLDTGWISSVGSYVTRFEAAVAERAGSAHGVATVNGTAALHTALLLAGVEADDEVVVPTLTFIAPVNAVRYVGAWPTLVDAEPDHWQMDVEAVRRFLEEECRSEGGEVRNHRTGRRVRAILPVHLLGHPVDMKPLLALAAAHGLAVIEDATESLGARYRGQPVGSLGDAGCFSFNGNKIVSTGGGGMLTTDRTDWAEKGRYLTTQAKDDPVEYVHGALGYNYRLTNVQAALGCAQMEQIDGFIGRKRAIAARYGEGLAPLPGVRPMAEAPWAESIFWLYTILIDPEEAGVSSREVLRSLSDAGIQSRPLWQPMHLSPVHAAAAPPGADFPVATSLYHQALSLPCSVGLTDVEQDRVLDALAGAVGAT